MTKTKDLTRSNIETEMHVLGAMLLDNRTIAGITEVLDMEDFTNADCAIAFQSIVSQWESGHEVTAGTASVEQPQSISDLIWDAYQGTGSAQGAIWYAEKVKEAATRRELAARARQVEHEAKTEKGDVGEIIGRAQTRMFEVNHKSRRTTTEEDFTEVQKASERAASSPYGTLGVPTGFRTIDNVTGGLTGGNLIILAARPSVGKTAAALNMYQNIVEQTDLRPMFFSGEMTRHQLLLRMASRRSMIDNNALARGNLSKEAWVKYTEACAELSNIMTDRAWIDDKSRPSPGHIRAIIKQKQQSCGVDVVFIDYLQIMSAMGKFSGRYEMLTEITGAMKAVAKDLDIPVVLLSQINRDGERDGDIRQPSLSALKGSGSIEEDADIVIFVHREDRMAGRGKFIIAKHRNGPLAEVPVTYEGCLTSFREVV